MLKRGSRQARELSLLSVLVILMKMMMMTAVEIEINDVMMLSIISLLLYSYLSKSGFFKPISILGRQIQILGVALVEYIDKRFLFGLGNSTHRWSALRAFRINTHRLDMTNSSQVMEEKVSLDVSKRSERTLHLHQLQDVTVTYPSTH